MARIQSFSKVVNHLGWSVFWVALTIVLPTMQAASQAPAEQNTPAVLSAQPAAPAAPVLTTVQRKKAEQSYMHQTLAFQPNVGQTDKRVQFLSQGDGYALFLTPSDAVLKLTTPPTKDLRGKITPGQYATLEMITVDGNKSAVSTGLEAESSHTNYIIGNDEKQWHSNVANYARVKYAGIYPGIDLTYYGNHSQLEYDFVVAPGADPKAIKIAFKGMKKIYLDAQGLLAIETAAGPVQLARPVLYQEKADGSHAIVQGKYELAKNEVSFVVGDYDKTKPLIIDPMLAFSTYLGGSGEENFAAGHVGNLVSGIAVDNTGASYVTGISTSLDFPFVGTQNAVTPLIPNAVYGFVSKFDPSGNQVYSTFLGGNQFYANTSDAAVPGGIAVDSTYHAYITGYTTTPNFPTNGQAVYQGYPYAQGYTGVMGFVTKLDSSGALNLNNSAYSTYLYSDIYGSENQGNSGQSDNGVGGFTYPTAIAVDAGNHAYITGAFDPLFAWAYEENLINICTCQNPNFQTYMNAGTYAEDLITGGSTGPIGSPTTHYSVYDTAYSAGVVELDQFGANILYFSYLGGNVNDVGTGIAVDANGGIYITGYTDSKDFPTSTELQPNPGTATRQAFVAKFDPTQSGSAQLVYSTYLGGSGATINGVLTGDEAHAIAVDGGGAVYVTGSTTSSDFPTNGLVPAIQGSLSGGSGDTDAFVAKIDATGSYLVFSTYLGGSAEDSGESIAVDANGNFYVAGYSYSLPSDFVQTPFPTTAGALPVDQNLGAKITSAGFVTEYAAVPKSMVLSTLLGSPGATGSMVGTGVAVDADGSIFVTGETGASDMPTTSNAIQQELHGTSDAFLMKIWPVTITDSDNIMPAALNFGTLNIGGTSPVHTITIASTSIGIMNMTTPLLSGAGAGSYVIAANTCTGQLVNGQSCAISVTFTPLNGGQYPAAIEFTLGDERNLLQTINVPLNGTASGLNVNPNPVNFGQVYLGTSYSPPFGVTLQNEGAASTTINSISIADPEYSVGTGGGCTTGAVLAPNGGTCVFYPSYTPTTTSGSGSVVMTITSTTGGKALTQTVYVYGQGIGLQLSPADVVFPDANVGGLPVPGAVFATNNSASPISFVSWSIPSGKGFSYDSQTSTCRASVPLAAGATCFFRVKFEPTVQGESQSTFTVTFGVDGNPASQTVNLIGTGVVPNVVVSPTSLSFPKTVLSGSSPMQQVLVTNTGGFALAFSGFSISPSGNYKIAATGAGTTCSTTAALAAATNGMSGGFCYIGVIFTPGASSAGNEPATLIITDNAGGTAGATQTVALTGTGSAAVAQGTFAPAGLTFTGTQVGKTSAPQTMTFTNTGNIPLTNLVISTSGATTILPETNNCPTTLSVGSSCGFSYTFTPTNVTTATAGISIADNAGTPQTAVITGTGAWKPTAVLSTTTLSFPTTVIGTTSARMTFRIKNTGNGPLQFQSIVIPAGSYTVAGSTCSIKTPLAALTGNCYVSIVFDPTVAGADPSTVTITDNSGNVTGAKQTVQLSGTGVKPLAQGTFAPTGLTFTGTEVGKISAPQTMTFTNTGNIPLTDIVISTSGSTSILQETNTCSATLAVNASCTFSYSFTPVNNTTVTAGLSIADNASAPQTAVITGTGAWMPTAVLSSTTLSFPNTAIGTTSARLTFHITNTGNGPLQFQSIVLPAGSFKIAAATCSLTQPLAASNGNCYVSIVFDPTVAGASSASVSITDNSGNTVGAKQTVTLSGTGLTTAAERAFEPAGLTP